MFNHDDHDASVAIIHTFHINFDQFHGVCNCVYSEPIYAVLSLVFILSCVEFKGVTVTQNKHPIIIVKVNIS